MITIRPGDQRGHTVIDWLDSYHTFSFDQYYDPQYMGFQSLRVLNEDRVKGGAGFPTHGHRDMEIITYVLEGALDHKDSLGNGSVIRPGEIQRMTAGTGISHSEFNHAATDPVHLLQIWILPEKLGLTPGYEQKPFNREEAKGRWRLLAARDGREGAVTIHQKAEVYVSMIAQGEANPYWPQWDHTVWLQVARGEILLNDTPMGAGDGAGVTEERQLQIRATRDAEILIFDLWTK